MRCRPIGTSAWRRAATTTTPSRWSSRGCWRRSNACSAAARRAAERQPGPALRMTEPAAGADRARRARLANMRQELLAPVTALVGYGELLTEQAERLDLVDLAPDLERIVTAAQELL